MSNKSAESRASCAADLVKSRTHRGETSNSFTRFETASPSSRDELEFFSYCCDAGSAVGVSFFLFVLHFHFHLPVAAAGASSVRRDLAPLDSFRVFFYSSLDWMAGVGCRRRRWMDSVKMVSFDEAQSACRAGKKRFIFPWPAPRLMAVAAVFRLLLAKRKMWKR